MNYLYLKDCLGLNKVDRRYYATEFQTLSDIERAGNLNPYQKSRLDQLRSAGNDPGNMEGIPSTGLTGSGSGGNLDVVGNAQKLLNFQKQANAPVVASLQSQQPGLQEKYTNLLSSIKGNQQLDTNRQTTVTNNELGKRGITSDSGIYGQEMTNALTPIDTQYAGLTANANAGSISDTQALALQIAQLQAGNPETAISGGLNYGSLQNQAATIASQNALAAAQAQAAQAQAGFYGNQGGYYTALANSLVGGQMSPIASSANNFNWTHG